MGNVVKNPILNLKSSFPIAKTTPVETANSQLDNSPDIVNSELDTLDKHRELEEAATHNWILSTTEIEELLGVKPKGETFTRGCWIFRRSGKIGNQSAWIVEKI